MYVSFDRYRECQRCSGQRGEWRVHVFLRKRMLFQASLHFFQACFWVYTLVHSCNTIQLAEKRWSGAERGAGGRGAGMERGAGSGGYTNRPERGAAFSALTLRSHALFTIIHVRYENRNRARARAQLSTENVLRFPYGFGDPGIALWTCPSRTFP